MSTQAVQTATGRCSEFSAAAAWDHAWSSKLKLDTTTLERRPFVALLMWTHVLRSAARPASAVVSIRIGGPALALAAAACGSAAGSVASANGAGGGTGPPTDAEAAEARRVLEAYFATTEPAEGGRGAVRLRKPVVDGEKSVGDYQRSLVDHDRSGTSDDEATVADPGPTRSPTAPVAAAAATVPWASTTLQALRELQAAFARARDWDQFHTPRNILIALTGEVGELAEIFQWKGEVARGLPVSSIRHTQPCAALFLLFARSLRVALAEDFVLSSGRVGVHRRGEGSRG